MLNIVLHEPEIPFNTGAIGRTCVATNTPLHLIRPYGFVLNDKYIKRAGMDYWEKLQLSEYLDYEDFLDKHPEIRFADDFCNTDKGCFTEGGEAGKVNHAAAQLKNSRVGHQKSTKPRSSGLRPQREELFTVMRRSVPMTTLCLGRSLRGYRKRFWSSIQKPAFASPCGEK